MVLISIHKEIIEIDLATLIYLIWNVSSHTISIVILICSCIVKTIVTLSSGNMMLATSKLAARVKFLEQDVRIGCILLGLRCSEPLSVLFLLCMHHVGLVLEGAVFGDLTRGEKSARVETIVA